MEGETEYLAMLCNLPEVSTKDAVRVGILPHQISSHVSVRTCMCVNVCTHAC